MAVSAAIQATRSSELFMDNVFSVTFSVSICEEKASLSVIRRKRASLACSSCWRIPSIAAVFAAISLFFCAISAAMVDPPLEASSRSD